MNKFYKFCWNNGPTLFVSCFAIIIIILCGVITNRENKQVLKPWETVVAETTKATVVIAGYTKDNEEISGSGFVVNSYGYILTNKHIVKRIKGAAWVTFNDTATFVVTDKWISKNSDLAMVKINQKNLHALDIQTQRTAIPGEQVAAITSVIPMCFYSTYGRVSKLNVNLFSMFSEEINSASEMENIKTPKTAYDFIVVPGNSGSPIVDQYGKVVGVVQGRLFITPTITLAVSQLSLQKAMIKFLEEIIKEKKKDEHHG